jgi:2-polyprenyl-6-methoxyphenol hydroxylase-like FAD-dependent oxidoreductase
LNAGWRVDVFERTEVELAGRGAGIVTHEVLIDALRAVGADIRDLGVHVSRRVAFDQAGGEVAAIDYPQIVTSWTRIHQILRALIPDQNYHLGQHITGYRQSGASVTAVSDKGDVTGDILIGADGFRSAIRAQMLPEIMPNYAGYVVWRAVAQEADLPADVHEKIFGAFGLYLPTGSQFVGYPIAGTGNDLRPGHRQYNFVWYVPQSEAALDDMLTDATGKRHAISIPPPLVRQDVCAAMMAQAEGTLPSPFVDMLRKGEAPFFTPIYDHHSPVMAKGRVALAGDAACVARPHVGMGVTKAALDALELSRALDEGHAEDALRRYSDRRVTAARAAYLQAQKLGGYIFAKPEGGENRDGSRNPHLDEIMRETAVTV